MYTPFEVQAVVKEMKTVPESPWPSEFFTLSVTVVLAHKHGGTIQMSSIKDFRNCISSLL